MKKYRVSKLFIAVMIFLPLQYAAVGIVGELHSEPWPAFTLPGFKNVYVTEDDLIQIEQKRFVIFEEDRSEPIELRPQEMFPLIPLSQVPGFMRTHFSDRRTVENLSVQAKQYLIEQVTKITGTEPERMELIIRVEKYRSIENELILDSESVIERISVMPLEEL